MVPGEEVEGVGEGAREEGEGCDAEEEAA